MKLVTFLILIVFLNPLIGNTTPISLKTWKTTNTQQLYLPVFSNEQDINGKDFTPGNLLEDTQLDLRPATAGWKELEIPADSLLSGISKVNTLMQISGYITSDRWVKAKVKLTTNSVYELYLDGKKIKSQAKVSDKQEAADLTLETGKHQLLLKLISQDENLKFGAELVCADDSSEAVLSWGLDETRNVTIHDILDGETISSAKISPSGKYVLINYREVLEGSGKSRSYSQVYDLEKQKNVYVLRNSAAYNADWLPSADRLTYSAENGDASDIYTYDPSTGEEKKIASGIEDLSVVRWLPNGDYIIFSRYVKDESKDDLKRIFGNDDRLPYFRNRSFLYLLTIESGTVVPLTAGYLSAGLHDIKPDGSKILFSTSKRDYTEVPFSKQDLYEMDLKTFEVDTIWKDKLYGGSCQYSPDGKMVLVSGGPECFGELGVKVSDGRIPNSYDSQLYLFDLKTKKAEAITRDFDPAVNQAYWAQNGKIYLSVAERDFGNLYAYDLKSKSFSKISLPVEVLGRIDYAKTKSVAVFEGTSMETSEQLYWIDLQSGKTQLLAYPEKERFATIQLGKTEDWNFTNANGTTIYGRVYYPVNYDPAKKYPVIVNYYGGTSPTDRSFGGRYPRNTWTANGYLVYVLQPSGATGFGQDFSALHVNGWGLDAIDDIIDGTKKFLGAHPSADAANVGCIGASYGGFTTMMLQTRTDIFKTAISHAGISAITSYWGEGYWGYSYSAGATKNSYPWNRKDVYVDNSPIYNADKFQNSILLLHGTSDTNVPVGESLQFYAALKILGKDVEMVLIDGQDHHILDYTKRLKWHDTIISWFDKKLKNQPDHWNEMYPEKNL